MKKINFICLLAIVFSFGACTEDLRIDPSVLPPVTETGANTFGCLVDDWAYVGGRYYNNGSPLIYNELHSIVFNYYEASNYIDVRIKIDELPDRYLKFTIKDVVKTAALPQNCTFENARFSGTTDNTGDESVIENGTVKITNFDTDLNIISGIFYGTKITEGRFDVHYIKR
ncbi:MAG: hypothetical protein LBN27_12880 [Prevotellaceae bacterium]|jgi:hypothetical protein|nr:hypothetical protein [Prevotellaceae bacterium]